MLVYTYFKGDTNKKVQWLQHDAYNSYVSEIFFRARKKYRIAEKLVAVSTELGEILKNTDSFDHRTIQFVHDAIAAKFRYDCAEELQPQLSFDGVPEEERILTLWGTFFYSELETLFEYPEFIRMILIATCFPNPDEQGMKAEEWIHNFLLEQYSFLTHRESD